MSYALDRQATQADTNMLLSMALLLSLWGLSSCSATAAVPPAKPYQDPEPERPAVVAAISRKEVDYAAR